MSDVCDKVLANERVSAQELQEEITSELRAGDMGDVFVGEEIEVDPSGITINFINGQMFKLIAFEVKPRLVATVLPPIAFSPGE
jgi:hypothetical protein